MDRWWRTIDSRRASRWAPASGRLRRASSDGLVQALGTDLRHTSVLETGLAASIDTGHRVGDGLVQALGTGAGDGLAARIMLGLAPNNGSGTEKVLCGRLLLANFVCRLTYLTVSYVRLSAMYGLIALSRDLDTLENKRQSLYLQLL